MCTVLWYDLALHASGLWFYCVLPFNLLNAVSIVFGYCIMICRPAYFFSSIYYNLNFFKFLGCDSIDLCTSFQLSKCNINILCVLYCAIICWPGCIFYLLCMYENCNLINFLGCYSIVNFLSTMYRYLVELNQIWDWSCSFPMVLAPDWFFKVPNQSVTCVIPIWFNLKKNNIFICVFTI